MRGPGFGTGVVIAPAVRAAPHAQRLAHGDDGGVVIQARHIADPGGLAREELEAEEVLESAGEPPRVGS